MCHVLIIEDEPLIAGMIREVLAGAGAATFDTAATQEAAVGSATARRPDFITSDVLLANGTGPAAVRAIVAAHGPIPCLYITGSPEACAPPDRVITKPFRPDTVSRTFRAMLGES